MSCMASTKGEIAYFDDKFTNEDDKDKTMIKWKGLPEQFDEQTVIGTNSTSSHKLTKIELLDGSFKGMICLIKSAKQKISGGDKYVLNETNVLVKLSRWGSKKNQEKKPDGWDGIVEFVGSGKHSLFGPILCMKYYDALNGYDYIKQMTKGHGLGEETGKLMARKFLTTLKYMHEQGVIHRD
eukprot:498966_1